MDNFYNNNNNNGTGDVFGDVYRDVMELRSKSRAWSVASLVLGILSILCCCIWWFGLIAGILSIVFVIVSRKKLGYFDGLSIAGLITSIFGIVFSILIIVVGTIVLNNPEFQAYFEQFMIEYEAELESAFIK